MLSDVDEDTPQPGDQRTVDNRVEQRVLVIAGQGQWAYWAGPDSPHTVVVDTIFNRHAHHFAGYLDTPYAGPEFESRWLVVRGWVAPPRERRLYIEDEDEGLPRMERRE